MKQWWEFAVCSTRHKIGAVHWCHNTSWVKSFTSGIILKTSACYTAISSPKQSGRLSAFSTFRSRAAPSAPTPSAWPQLSRSSLSSVLDSYSEPIPDSLKRSSSRAPRTCSPSSELSSLGVSPGSWPCSWASAARDGKRKHSSRTALPPSPWRLTSAPVVPGEQGWGNVETQALSLTWSSDWDARAPVDEEPVSGSWGVLGGLARKVISSRLSWEPTERKSEDKCFRWCKEQREFAVITCEQR